MMFPKPKHKRRPKERVVKIKLQEEKECWLCLTTQNLENHHIFDGNGRRSKSEKYGLKVYLCHNHHNENISGDPGIHFDGAQDDWLKRHAQEAFEKVYSRELFMKEFGRNYL